MLWRFWQNTMTNITVNAKLALLQSWVAQQNFPQALALELDAGTEPAPLALSIAQSLLCHENNPPDCHCQSCILLSEGTHPDVHWFLDKVASIDDVRQISRLNSLSATLGHGRLICLNNAEHLNLNAANALLKTLEEPNLGVHFLLFTRHFDSVLPTIRSRLRLVSYREHPQSFETYWSELCKDDKAKIFLQDFFALIKQEKLPSDLAQYIHTQGLLQGLEWLYLAFSALLWDSSMQQSKFTPEGVYTRYSFERYNETIARIKELMQLLRGGSALQPLLTIEALLVPYLEIA